MKYLQLKNSPIPILGFGTWQLRGEDCYNAVKYALKVGYRHIDTAHVYGNHLEVSRAIKDSKTPREEIFLTTKIWRDDLGYDHVHYTVQNFLKELETDYINLLLIHWPNNNIPLFKTLQAFHELIDQGIVYNIGVSNFTSHHLEDALTYSDKISVNQVEFHPTLVQNDLLQFCKSKEIQLTAYSPLGHGQDIGLELINQLAQKYSKTPAQIILNWLIQKDIIAIPKATTPQYIEDNFNIFDFEIDKEDQIMINSLNTNNRMVNPEFNEFNY